MKSLPQSPGSFLGLTPGAISWMPYITLVAFLSFSLAGCGGGEGTHAGRQPTIHEQYSSAVSDARVATVDEISNTLTPIVSYNGRLIWENNVVGSRLLVATVIDDNGKYYKCEAPGGCAGDTCREGGNCSSYRWDSWVTVAPEMYNMLGGKSPSLLRVVQLLGLPPSYATAGGQREAKYVLELWVSPGDLFRPCPDSEISDTACETAFPADQFRMFDINNRIRATEGLSIPVFRTYTGWFNNRTRNVYTATDSSDAYPWTRLGYTYDWGGSNHVGLSEYVVHGKKEDGSTISVGIRSLKTIEDYFK